MAEEEQPSESPGTPGKRFAVFTGRVLGSERPSPFDVAVSIRDDLTITLRLEEGVEIYQMAEGEYSLRKPGLPNSSPIVPNPSQRLVLARNSEALGGHLTVAIARREVEELRSKLELAQAEVKRLMAEATTPLPGASHPDLALLLKDELPHMLVSEMNDLRSQVPLTMGQVRTLGERGIRRADMTDSSTEEVLAWFHMRGIALAEPVPPPPEQGKKNRKK